mmetsp:Transcript_37104/g.115459  ORF Transcript_37104/g.115459 Transcript_37104/m.115459 type:complete len:228 (-) Transcript_37104:565-1248(-)
MAPAMLVGLLEAQHVAAANEGRLPGTALRTLAHVVPIRQLRVALPASAPVQRDGGDTPLLELRHQLVRIAAAKLGRLLVLAVRRAHLQRERLRPQRGGHAPHDALHGPRPRHEARAGAAAVHLLQGAATIDVHKVAIDLLVDELRDLGHALHVAAGDLHAEDLLAGVTAEQGELACASLQDGAGQRHLAHGHLAPQLDAQPPEGQVPHGGERRQNAFPAQVQGPALR